MAVQYILITVAINASVANPILGVAFTGHSSLGSRPTATDN